MKRRMCTAVSSHESHRSDTTSYMKIHESLKEELKVLDPDHRPIEKRTNFGEIEIKVDNLYRKFKNEYKYNEKQL